MSGPIEFSVAAVDGAARTGRIQTAHGVIDTPAFMPVGTRAAVKAMAPDELWSMGYRMVLANAYHLAIRPGAELIRDGDASGREDSEQHAGRTVCST